MTVLLWILAILALPTLAVLVWLGGVFVKEYRRVVHSDADEDYTLPAPVAALGLLSQGEQDTERAAPLPGPVSDAMHAARKGEWQPAAALLRTIGRSWERRSHAVGLLAEIAADEDGWLLAWEAARPEDPDAAVVRASSTVGLASKLRGAKRAQYTTREQLDGFHRTLARAREEIARAAALDPQDPTPYITEIWVAVGLGYPHAEMDRLWAEVTSRAPHHYEAHFYALQYWSAKWRGSEQLATEFAAEAAAGAPPGSLLTAMPLIAHFEHDESEDTAADRTPEMVARVDAGLVDAAAADPDHPRLPELRHLLACYLSLQDRDAQAVEQFRLVDGYVGALPWRYEANPAVRYCLLRDASVIAAA